MSAPKNMRVTFKVNNPDYEIMPWCKDLYFDFPIIFTIWKMWTGDPYFLVQGFALEVPPYRGCFGWFTLKGDAHAPGDPK